MSTTTPAKRWAIRLLLLAISVFVIQSFGNSPASAESPSTTVTSSYDASNPDNLQFSYMVAAPQCDDITMNQNWSSSIQVANLSDNTPLSVSIEEGKGGTVYPQGYATLTAHGTGSTATDVTLSYLFEADGTSEETTTFTIQAPDNGCMGKGGASEINCTLLNFTDQSVINKDGTYNTGTVVKLDTSITGANADQAKTITYAASVDGSPFNELQSGSNTSYDLLLNKAGTWAVSVYLADADGNPLHVDEDNCFVTLDAVKASDSGTGTTTPPTTTPPTTVPPTTVDTSSNAGSGTTTPDTTASGVLGSTTEKNAASATELPRTGAHTTTMVMVSLALLMFGGLLTFLGRIRKPRPIVEPEWMQAMQALGNE